VDCGDVVSCPAEKICDRWAHRCYDIEGSCASAAHCPFYDGAIARVGDQTCEEELCRVRLKPIPLIPGLEPEMIVDVISPAPAESFATVEGWRLRWVGPEGAVIALVLREVPAHIDDVLAAAMWGMERASGTESATWADGVAIRAGRWTGVQATADAGTPLYALIQIVEKGTLRGASAPIPFLIGAEWPKPGMPCDDPGVIAGSCASPARLQGCDPLDRACAVVCASYRDCVEVDPSLECGQPRGGARYCE